MRLTVYFSRSVRFRAFVQQCGIVSASFDSVIVG